MVIVIPIIFACCEVDVLEQQKYRWDYYIEVRLCGGFAMITRLFICTVSNIMYE